MPSYMSDLTLQNLRLDEFLVIINARDVDGAYVVPKPDVADKLAREIEEKTGLRSRNLASERSVETFKHWINAQPGRFITETRIAIDGVCALLKEKAAKSFEIEFRNTKDQLNWGDRVLLAVRYECAT